MILLHLFACAPEQTIAVSKDTGTAVDDTAADTDDTAPEETDTAPEETDTAPVGTDTAPVETAETGDTGEPVEDPWTAARCFGDVWGDAPPVDYDQFGPVVGSHCYGTDHQEIEGVERVVFIGDSITVGSPPTASDDWYRNVLAEALADRFGLEAPAWDWQNVDLLEGMTYEMESGDFAACAKWGARTDDLMLDPHRQFETCIPEDERDKKTLIVMTVGGNDVYSLLEDINAGVDEATLRETFAEAMAHVRDAASWVTEDPERFPNGVYLVFANIYDFTDADGAADMATCPGAELIGMDAALTDPVFWDIMGAAQEEFMSIAVDTRTDMVFLGENFCGHGYAYDDATKRCYRGTGAELYLDFTCMHPSEFGHAAIADMMLGVIDQ